MGGAALQRCDDKRLPQQHVIPTGAETPATAQWRKLPASILRDPRVERTPPSAAFEVDLCETCRAQISRATLEDWTLCSHRLLAGFPRQQLPQHILQNPAISVVERFLRRVDADEGFELDFRLGGRGVPSSTGPNFNFLPSRIVLNQIADAGNLENLFAGEMERIGVLSSLELQRQNSHAD